MYDRLLYQTLPIPGKEGSRYRAKTDVESMTFTEKTGHMEKWNIDVQGLADKLHCEHRERLTSSLRYSEKLLTV